MSGPGLRAEVAKVSKTLEFWGKTCLNVYSGYNREVIRVTCSQTLSTRVGASPGSEGKAARRK